MCNQNQFDFYTVKAQAVRVGDLVRAGIPRASCHKRFTGQYRKFGYKSVPVTRWEAVVGYVDVCSDTRREQLAELESKHKSDGVCIYARYHAMD
jgi:hypothetical protein